MNELTLKEREFLDNVNQYNKKYVTDEVQCLWNVCYGYLHGMFDSNLLNLSENEIRLILTNINEKTPRVDKVDENSVNTHGKSYTICNATLEKNKIEKQEINSEKKQRKPMSEEAKKNIREGILKAKLRKQQSLKSGQLF